MTTIHSSTSVKTWQVTLSTLLFTLCSSTMLILNKLTVTFFPAPGLILVAQLLSSSAITLLAAQFDIVSLKGLEFKTAKPYIFVSLIFLATLYANMNVLRYANVETFIVFRSCTPILISILDFIFLGRQLPALRSSLSLFGLVLGAVRYVHVDSHFEVRAYSWVACWFLTFSFDQIYIKSVVSGVELSPWARSLCTNAFAVIPALILGILNAETKIDISSVDTRSATSFIVLSCINGLLMSVSSFHLRALVSATCFTVIGTACKIISVFINYILWDKHASLDGLSALAFCIFCALWYRQAPLRDRHSPTSQHAKNVI